MTYSVMNKTFVMTQKFCLVLVFMSVIIMAPLIIHMKGYERALTSLLYSYAFAQSVSGARMTYDHLGFYASLISPTSITH